MAEQLPAILVIAPLLGALLLGLVGTRDPRVCLPVVFAALGVALFAAAGLLRRVLSEGPVDYFIGGWEKPLGIGILLRADSMNAPVLVLVALVALLVASFSRRPAGERDAEKSPQYYALFLLLCTALFGIVVTADAFNLFVLVEVSALSSYGLVAIGSSRRCKVAALHYLVMGTVGASFYLLGTGYLYLSVGSLNIADIHQILASNEAAASSRAVRTAFVLMIVGVWVKMAFFPLHGWLPNAYSYCPSASSSLLAPLMTKVSVYVMVRLMTGVFGLEWVFGHLGWNQLVVWFAIGAILAGSLLALAQREIKKMLCYLIVAEVGYMVGGAWLGDPGGWGLSGALYHILGDGLMTLTLFLAAGIFAKRLGAIELGDLSGLFRKMPLASVGFVVGGLAMIGVPPTCGFFSKFYLVRGGIESGQWAFVAALLVSSLVNAVLFFRLFEIAHFGKEPPESHAHHGAGEGEGEGEGDHGGHAAAEPVAVPAHMLVPLLLAAAGVVLLGLLNGPVVAFLRESFAAALAAVPAP